MLLIYRKIRLFRFSPFLPIFWEKIIKNTKNSKNTLNVRTKTKRDRYSAYVQSKIGTWTVKFSENDFPTKINTPRVDKKGFDSLSMDFKGQFVHNLSRCDVCGNIYFTWSLVGKLKNWCCMDKVFNQNPLIIWILW